MFWLQIYVIAKFITIYCSNVRLSISFRHMYINIEYILVRLFINKVHTDNVKSNLCSFKVFIY